MRLLRGGPTARAQCHSWLAGFCLAFPFAYPSVPYYWIGFGVFGSMLFYFRQQMPVKLLVLIIVAMLSAILSNVLGLSGYYIGERQLFGSVLFYCFFVFGALVPDLQRFYKGLFAGICTVSVLVFIAFFVERPYEAGTAIFTVAEHRLWGVHYFPDWPNFLAFMLALGFLIGMFIERRPWWAIFCLMAALMTTSRPPLFAIALFLIFAVLKMNLRARAMLLILGGGALLGGTLFFLPTIDFSGEFFVRLFLFSDRAEVYSAALRLFENSPFFGSGAVLLDESVGNFGAASFHNAYLDILVRQGLLGLLIFLALIIPDVHRIRKETLWLMGPIILFFLIPSFFQNFLKHPHLLMIYSALLAGGRQKEDV
ncbi:O-antigen ligase family protein [Pseudomonas sp. SDO5271_S396]